MILNSDLCDETTTSTFLDYYTAYLRMAASDICLLQRQIPMALSLLLALVYLTTIRPAAVAKELHRTCEEIQELENNSLQGLPMMEESGEYHLTIVAYGESCGWKTPTAGANFAIHVHNDALVHEKEVVTDQQHNRSNKHLPKSC
ncbi:Hypothetical predicted protein [Podarcis lilfordi]|uniref:Uncharacterized protein n=1 Tax=Podarcis lilfordi TaxID=74358 RepID=A0AA35PHN9_9SAUR|nr:Hypothetical predicted protein [Podarcis lilfordi]